MQEKNEKISGIMADDDKGGSNIDSLIKKINAKESVEDIGKKKKLIQSKTQKFELSNEDNHDIDKEINELETLIKRLQDEIVEMSETANKQLPSNCPGFSVIEESSACCNGTCYASPEISNEEESVSDIGFPIISKDDGMLEQQVKMFGENISNIIKASDSAYAQKDALDDVRRNFIMLWDDPIKSNKSNLDLTEKPTETLSSKLSTAFNFSFLPSSLENNKLSFINNISIESIKSVTNNAQIEQSENVSEFCEGTSPNDEDKKISSDNKLPGDSIGNDDISVSGSEAVSDNIINNVPILLNADISYNLPGNIKNHPSTNTTIPKDNIINLPKPETVETAKTTIMKTLQNVTSSDNTCCREPSQVIFLATSTNAPEMMQTQSVTHENAIPKTDSIFKSFNRKIRKIVGRNSEKSISNEKHKSEDLSDDIPKELRKAFPRSKSEPSKNFYTTNDDSSIIDPNNMIALNQDSPKNVIKGVSDTINMNNSETSNIKAAENSNDIINIVKTIIPKFAYDLIIDNTDKSKSVTENPSDTTNTTPSIPKENDPPNKNFILANLVEIKPIVVTTDNKKKPINIANDPQTVLNLSRKNPEEGLDSSSITSSSSTTANPTTWGFYGSNPNPVPDLSRKNPEEDLDVDSSSITSGSSATANPKTWGFYGSNPQTDGQQENVMKAEVSSDQIIAAVQEKKVKIDAEAVEDEDDEDEDDEENEDDGDDDDTDDVD